MNYIMLAATPFAQNYSLQSFIWIIVLFVAIIVELIVKRSIGIWFCPGAMLCFILASFETKFTYQVIIFLSLSIVLLFITHLKEIRILLRRLQNIVAKNIKPQDKETLEH